MESDSKSVQKISKKYSHVKSKVSQYIQQIKDHEAEHKKQKQESFIEQESPPTSYKLENIITQNEKIIEYLIEERCELKEKFLQEQQKVYELQTNSRGNERKVITRLKLEPCECWNPEAGTFQTPTMSSVESTLYTESTSYKQININISNYPCRNVCEYRPTKFVRIQLGERIREILTKTLCLTPKSRLVVATQFYINESVSESNEADEDPEPMQQLDNAIAKVHEIIKRVTKLKRCLRENLD